MMGNNGTRNGGERELWLFTIRFPFGHGESFLENELPILARGFARIRVFPLIAEGEPRKMPVNVEVVRLFDKDVYKAQPAMQLFRDLRRGLHVWRKASASAPSREVYAKHRRTLMSKLRQALYREQVFTARFASEYDPARVVLYSYWTSDWATVLGLWKLKDPRVHFVSRMMGFDMFDHRAADNWQMFQAFHVEQVERIYVIALAGLQHMRERYPQAAAKVALSHLATNDNGTGPWSPVEVLRIASCSNLIPLKRVHLLAEAIRIAGIPVHWVHFGEGDERQRIEAIVRTFPDTVRVELKGSLPNAEVIAYYRNNPVDVFVHTSETEGGAPVALQEAASFGIPLIGADAGGVCEVVTSETGVLLPLEVGPELLARSLTAFREGPWYTAEARAMTRAFWASHFNAESVHTRLLDQLLHA